MEREPPYVYRLEPDWRNDPNFYDKRNDSFNDPATQARYQESKNTIQESLVSRYYTEELSAQKATRDGGAASEAEAYKDANSRAETYAKEYVDSFDWKKHQEAVQAKAQGEQARGEIVIVRDFSKEKDMRTAHRYETDATSRLPRELDNDVVACGESQDMRSHDAIRHYNLPRADDPDLQPETRDRQSANVVASYRLKDQRDREELAIKDDCAPGTWTEIDRNNVQRIAHVRQFQHEGGGQQAYIIEGRENYERIPQVRDTERQVSYELDEGPRQWDMERAALQREKGVSFQARKPQSESMSASTERSLTQENELERRATAPHQDDQSPLVQDQEKAQQTAQDSRVGDVVNDMKRPEPNEWKKDVESQGRAKERDKLPSEGRTRTK